MTCKKEPEQAVEGVLDWVVQERKERADRESRDAEKKAKSLEARDKRDANQLQGSLARLGIVTPSTSVGQHLPSAMTTTTTSTPISNPTSLEDDVAGTAPPVGNNIDARPIRHKPLVNGVTNRDSRSMSPPRTLVNLG